MTFIMRDSITATNIPTDTPVVAGYGDGFYEWSSADWQRFPETVSPQSPLSIVVSAQDIGDILDVESGDALPFETVGWRDRFNRPSRRRASIYCNRSTWIPVFAYVGNTVDYWIATLNGTLTIESIYWPDGANPPVAIQMIDNGLYDTSVILDPTWVNVAVQPTPQPAPQPVIHEYDMLVVSIDRSTVPSGTDWPGVWFLSGSLYVHIDSDVVLASFVNDAKLATVTIDYAQHQAILAARNALTGTLSVNGTFTVR